MNFLAQINARVGALNLLEALLSRLGLDDGELGGCSADGGLLHSRESRVGRIRSSTSLSTRSPPSSIAWHLPSSRN